MMNDGKSRAGVLRLGILLCTVMVLAGCGKERAVETIMETEMQTMVQTEPETKAPMTEAETEAPETEAPFEEDPLFSYFAEVTDTDQLVLVLGDDSAYGASLYYFEKDENGHFVRQLETLAQIGRNGFNPHTIEGDETTPLGLFDLGLAFGSAGNPGTTLPWVDVNEHLYWIDDLASDYYNQLIDDREVPTGWSSGEHLIEYTNSYRYAVNIEVNPACTKDSTSAIFLHCYGRNPYSLGCVAIPEADMVRILEHLRPGAKILITES